MMTVFYVGTIPMTLAVVTRLIMLHDPFYYALATMAVGVHIYFAFLAKGLQQTALQMLEFRAQKDVLIAELDEERQISEEARRHAEAGSKQNRAFATMSHELRTPLNAIMGFSEVTKDEIFGAHTTPVYREYASDIHDSGRHLLQLINEILDLSRIEAGRYELNEERTHLGDIAQDCERLLRLRAEEQRARDHRGHLTRPAAGLGRSARAPADLHQPVVECAEIHAAGRTHLRDRGPGRTTAGSSCSSAIPDPAFRATRSRRSCRRSGRDLLAHETAEGGTGLGLPIVKSLIELHNGTFELRSSRGAGPRSS